ncbi:MAG: cytochrome c [Anaerolineales bacterium]|nr:cytochrome c [Anaerolineales bacterium]
MVARMFSWLAGLTLVLVFLVIISPDLFRGYVFSQDERSSGRRVYETYCIGCHGQNGLGDGEAAVFLNPQPRNFVNGQYKFFYFSEAGPLPSDESLKLTIRNGIQGSAMPAFPLLTDQEIGDVTTYLKNLREGGWVEPEPVQAAGVSIEGTTGSEIFTNAGCNACHQFDPLGSVGGIGPDLTQVGSRLSVDEIKDSVINPTAVTAAECPGGPCPQGVMPQYFKDRLTPEQIDTLATYLAEQK